MRKVFSTVGLIAVLSIGCMPALAQAAPPTVVHSEAAHPPKVRPYTWIRLNATTWGLVYGVNGGPLVGEVIKSGHYYWALVGAVTHQTVLGVTRTLRSAEVLVRHHFDPPVVVRVVPPVKGLIPWDPNV